jgi:HEAT repeat protein
MTRAGRWKLAAVVSAAAAAAALCILRPASGRTGPTTSPPPPSRAEPAVALPGGATEPEEERVRSTPAAPEATDPVPGTGGQDDEIRAAVARFKDTTRPLPQRREEISSLARKADPRSIRILMAVGEEKTYLNWAAVEALGSCVTPEVTRYLKGKLSAGEPRILSSAIRSYVRHRAEEAIPDLVDLLKRNRTRPDGYEKEVCSEIVKVLGKLGSAEAVPALSEELERYKESAWNLEYGSVVVAALGRIGTPEAQGAISTYADRLSDMKPKDRLARRHFEEKIAEARAAARGEVNDALFERSL